MDGCENLLKNGKPKKKERSWKKPIQVTYKINGRQKKENIILMCAFTHDIRTKNIGNIDVYHGDNSMLIERKKKENVYVC